MNIHDTHRRQDRAVTAVVGGVCAVGFAGSVSPLIEHTITAALLTVAGLTVVVSAARWVVRVLREQREDRADALAGAAWRARYRPDHVPVAADRAEVAS